MKSKNPKFCRGVIWEDDIGPAKIMEYADEWVMMRRSGCMPFVLPIGQLIFRSKWKYIGRKSKIAVRLMTAIK